MSESINVTVIEVPYVFTSFVGANMKCFVGNLMLNLLIMTNLLSY